MPDLVITDVDDAFATEDDALQRERAKFVDSYRRRFGAASLGDRRFADIGGST